MRQKPGLYAALLVGISSVAVPALAQQQPTLVVDLAPGTYIDGKYHVEQPHSSRPRDFQEVRGRLVFHATTPDAEGRQHSRLWTTDGTAGGTRLLHPLLSVEQSAGYPGHPATYLYYLPRPLTRAPVADVLVFPAAADAAHGLELWSTDGTPEGTVLLRDITPGPGDSFPEVLAVLEGTVLFSVYTEGRWELWRTEGTAQSTQFVSALPGRATQATVASSTVFFTVSDNELWRTDGTATGTANVRTFPNPIYSLTGMGSRVFFSARDTGTSHTLWRSDGTATVLVKDLSPLTLDGPSGLIATQDRLFFSATHPDTGNELWSTNGSEEDTRLARDIHPGAGSSFPYFPTQLDEDRIVFFANAAENGDPGLWVSDGTEGGTRLLLRVRPAFESLPLRLGTKLCFSGHVEPNPATLVCTDGTEDGTAVIAPDVTGVEGLRVVNGSLLFWAANQLWTSGGTDDTTRVLTQGGNTLWSSEYHVQDDLLLFDTGDLQTGRELHALTLDEPLPLPPVVESDPPDSGGGCASGPAGVVAPVTSLMVLLWLARRRARS